MQRWKIEWSHGCFTVFADGASVHDVTFFLNAHLFKPLAEAPWQASFLETSQPAHPRHLQLLGGEWPCVPFGSTHHDPAHHGYGSNNEWHLIDKTDNGITLGIDYPEYHPIKGLKRTICGVDGRPELRFSLTVEPRITGRLPIGLHPIFKLDDNMKITKGAMKYGKTFPDIFELGQSVFIPDKDISPTGVVATGNGFASIFYGYQRGQEELVQLYHCDGNIEVSYPSEQAKVSLTWDKSILPHCLLWISNQGRHKSPWNSQFRGIGIEPVNSYFDINDTAPHTDEFGVLLRKNIPLKTEYALSARSAH